MPMASTNLDHGLRAEADLSRIAGRLSEVAASRFDLVAPQSALRCKGVDRLLLDLGTPQITDHGVTESLISASYTRTAWRQIAERLRIPLQYLDRLVGMENTIGPRLACHSIDELALADERSALYRFVETDEGYVLRAVLSDRYRPIDNDTALQAIIAGLTEHGLGLGDCEVTGDVTADRLRLRIAVPAIELAVPLLLGDYRMPFSLRPGNPVHARPDADETTPPVLWAGIEITNSETGMGAFSVAPRAVVNVCRNGLTKAVDFRRAHLGVTLEEGTIDWSQQTQDHALALISSQVHDAVATFLSRDYLIQVAREMQDARHASVIDTTKAIEAVQVRLGLTEGERNAVFELFAAGGQRTVLGLGQAVTAAAQLADDGDRQSDMESMFWQLVSQPNVFVGAGS